MRGGKIKLAKKKMMGKIFLVLTNIMIWPYQES
jgi:hypothetical protein